MRQTLLYLYGGVVEVDPSCSLGGLVMMSDMYTMEGLKEVVAFNLNKEYCHFFHRVIHQFLYKCDFFYAPALINQGHVVFGPSICPRVHLSVCLSAKTLTFAKPFKVPIVPNYKGVCLPNTSKPHSYHLKYDDFNDFMNR